MYFSTLTNKSTHALKVMWTILLLQHLFTIKKRQKNHKKSVEISQPYSYI